MCELHEFCEIFEKSVPKPAKAGGTRWIGHKMNALNIVLQNLKVLGVSMQKERHDRVLVLRHLCNLIWTMVKLDILVKSSLQGSTLRLTNYTIFLQNCEDDKGTKTYQDPMTRKHEI